MKERLVRMARVAWAALRNFFADGGLDMAATVAFYTLLSLGPLLYLLALILGRVFQTDASVAQAVARVSVYLPPEATATIQAVATRLPRKGGGLAFALPGLIWVATSAFSALDHSINVSFGSASTQSLWRKRLKALVVVVGGCVLLALAAVGGAVLRPVTHVADGLVRLPLAAYWVPRLTLQLFAFASLLLLYRFIPRAQVGWGAAASGAAVTFVLSEAGRRLFSMVLANSAAYGLLTGGVAGSVALLLWIYTAVALILIGAELAAVINGNRRI